MKKYSSQNFIDYLLIAIFPDGGTPLKLLENILEGCSLSVPLSYNFQNVKRTSGMTQPNKNKTILFLHGFLGISQDLKVIMDHMSEKGYQVSAFNFAGHGIGAKWPDEFRVDLFARELDQHIKANHLNQPIVFGYSLGGYVALYHKANFEDSSISQIITYGTKFNWSENSVAREVPMLDPEHLLAKFPHVADALKTKHGDRWKSLLHSTAHMMQHLERIDGLTREDLGDIDIPITLILGDQDRVVSSEETNLTANRLRKGVVKTLTHSKHELERTNLRELSDLIASAID